MLDVVFIPQILNNMVEFLKPHLPESILNDYLSILEMDPMEQKSAIQREIKPYEFALDDFIIDTINRNGMKTSDFKQEDLLKFRRYLSALCDAV